MRPRSGPGVKRLALAVVVLLVLLLVADRAGAAYAGRAIAAEVQRAAGLPSPPDVDVTGFPFLTQAVSGRYERIEVGAADVPLDSDLVVSRVDATLQGVQVPLSEVLSQSVQDVPAERVTARALVPYEELSQSYGDQELTIEPDDDRLRITGQVQFSDRMLSVVALSRVEVVDGELLLSAEEVGLAGQGTDEGSTSALQEALELRLPVQELPYGLTATSAEVQADGVELHAEASDVVLDAG